MKRWMTAVAASAMLAAISMPAFAQTATTKCAAGDGQILEYDFPLDESGVPGINSFRSARLVLSDCATGKPTKTTFRGVNAELKSQGDVDRAIQAGDILTDIGLTDPAAIKQLLDRVAAVKAKQAKQPKKKATAEKKADESFFPFGDTKKK